MLQLEAAATQDELTLLANRLSSFYGGSDRRRLLPRGSEATSLERHVLDATREMLAEEDERTLAEPVVHGLRYLLAQPEFAESGRASALAEMLDDRGFLKEALPALLAGEQVRVVIGDEVDALELQPCSLVLARYGAPGDVGGIVAVIGPKRMPYDRTIASVRLVSRSLTELVQTLS